MKRKVLCALVASLCAVAIVAAAGARVQKQREIQPCESRGSQAEASDCAHREYKAADAQLNKVYGQLAGILDAEDKASLKESELAWIKYRDSTCVFESSQYKGGTMRGMIESFCLTRVTKARTADLKDQFELRR
jgi:uncharacterized protein YecT (DUF1311 family)